MIEEINVPIFDIKKIKEFICWPREIPEDLKLEEKEYIKAKGTSKEAPKL